MKLESGLERVEPGIGVLRRDWAAVSSFRYKSAWGWGVVMRIGRVASRVE